jgi:hypothetical protein
MSLGSLAIISSDKISIACILTVCHRKFSFFLDILNYERANIFQLPSASLDLPDEASKISAD